MKYLLAYVFLFISYVLPAQDMSYKQIDKIVRQTCDSVSGGDGGWQLFVEDRLLILIADQSHNRMRIISPIADRQSLEDVELENALIANFHSALDVKYAISEGVLWSAFIHPLKELSDHQLRDAVSQVYSAAETFGTSYQSTELFFPGSQPPKKETKTKPKNSKIKKL